jgi:anti-sigma B factor antagonist
MDVSIHHELDAVVITVTGEIDAASAPALESLVGGFVDDDVGAESVLFDIGRVTFIDSAGLVLIARLARRMQERRRRLSLRRPNDGTRRLLEITGVADLVEIVPHQ